VVPLARKPKWRILRKPSPRTLQQENSGWGHDLGPLRAPVVLLGEADLSSNGEHNAGIQVLNTSNYPDNLGPLGNLNINLNLR
jgi:hypothetical protein